MLQSLAEEFADRLDTLSQDELAALAHSWRFWGRPSQFLPPGKDWWLFLLLGGRGGGKTRAGAEAVRQWVEEGYDRIALVGPTTGDVVKVMLNGESGLLNIFPEHQRPRYIPSQSRVVFHTGASAYLFSSEVSDRLRGFQATKAWCDEFAAWQHLEDTWSNLRFGLRIGDAPQIVATTTPRPLDILRDLSREAKDPTSGVVIRVLKTTENAANVTPGFLRQVLRDYGGTRLGKQELEGEILEPVGSLFHREQFRWHPTGQPLPPGRTYVAVDPAISTKTKADETGIVVVRRIKGRDPTKGDEALILEDLSGHYEAAEWAQKAIDAVKKWNALGIVVETNIVGNVVKGIIRLINPHISVTEVNAREMKGVRADYVSGMFEQRRVIFAEPMKALEDQLVSFDPRLSRQKGNKSPDRLDAMVWGVLAHKFHIGTAKFTPLSEPIFPNNDW